MAAPGQRAFAQKLNKYVCIYFLQNVATFNHYMYNELFVNHTIHVFCQLLKSDYNISTEEFRTVN